MSVQSASPAQGAPRGLTIDTDQRLFGAAFDGRIMRRFFEFMRPYRGRLMIALGAVVAFTVTQLSIPIVIRAAIDGALLPGAFDGRLLNLIAMGFVLIILVNLAATYLQETIVGKTAERVLFDLRRAMYVHLQHLSMSFMDKTEVGRIMSRLQGDVGALQDFLDTIVTAIGDILLLFGIVTVLLYFNWQLGLLTLSVVAVLLVVRMIWLPMAKKALVSLFQPRSGKFP